MHFRPSEFRFHRLEELLSAAFCACNLYRPFLELLIRAARPRVSSWQDFHVLAEKAVFSRGSLLLPFFDSIGRVQQ